MRTRGQERLIAILRGRQRALSNTPVYLRVWPLKTSPIWDAGGRQVYSRGILRLGSGLAIAGGLYGKNDREFWVIIKAFVVHGLGGTRLKRKGIVKLNKARWVNERLTSIVFIKLGLFMQAKFGIHHRSCSPHPNENIQAGIRKYLIRRIDITHHSLATNCDLLFSCRF